MAHLINPVLSFIFTVRLRTMSKQVSLGTAWKAYAVIVASVHRHFTRDSPPRLNVAAATSPERHILSLKPRGIKVCFSPGHPTKIPINRDEKC